jgi:hypothetical protein
MVGWVLFGITVVVLLLLAPRHCSLDGHKPSVYAEKGWYSPGEEYGHVKNFQIDGINRVHLEVFAECARCGEQFRVVRVHVPMHKLPTWLLQQELDRRVAENITVN